jgi:heptaprenyl diphosphate synthase
MRRQEIYESIFGARVLFIAGLLIMPSLLFNPDTGYRCLQFFFFWFLTWLSGKKSNPVFTLAVLASIIIFNLIIPYGHVLFSVGLLKITSGALKAGIHRAVTFEGLVMLSKVSVRQDLKLPGAFGELLAESLKIFTAMMSRKYRITGKNIFVEIDNLLLELSCVDIPTPAVCNQKTKPAGFIIVVIILLMSWLPYIASFKI